MNKYRVQYFNTIKWDWVVKYIVAENEESIVEFITNDLPISCRTKPYEGMEDSLHIEFLQEVTLPLVVSV